MGLTQEFWHGCHATEAARSFLRIEAATPLKRERRKATDLRSVSSGQWSVVGKDKRTPRFSSLSELPTAH
jgi:hypothetical protein